MNAEWRIILSRGEGPVWYEFSTLYELLFMGMARLLYIYIYMPPVDRLTI